MDYNIKLSYAESIILIFIIVIIILSYYKIVSYSVENLVTDNANSKVKIKTNQCDKCTLYGNTKNSFKNIYKESLNNRIIDWNKNK